jgi:ribosomal protein S18 acetylase RimI-like enzyme
VEVSLRALEAADQTVVPKWAAAVAGGMSRTRPLDAAADRHDPAAGLFWYVIVADGRDVGTVWIEVRPEASGGEAADAVLGILIGDPLDRGRGIGTAAVGLAVAAFREAHARLPVVLHVRRSNAAAVACYRRAGFAVTGEGAKALPSGASIPYYRMTETERSPT